MDWADVEGRHVLEIGPGKGALTRDLAARAAHLTLIEIDPRLAARWREEYAGCDAVSVIEGDALAVDLEAIEAPVHVVANLPYESGTAIVMRLLEASQAGWPGLARPAVVDLVVMLQKEVCQRLLAADGKHYGTLAVHVGLRADVEAGRVVAPAAFRPAPKVDSQIVRIRPLPGLRHAVGDEKLFSQLVKAAFAQRRKMLRNTVEPWLDGRVGADCGRGLLETVGIDRELRPERVPLERFAALCAAAHRLLQNNA